MAIEIVVLGTPVSQQARRRARVRAWIDVVAEAARRVVQPSAKPLQRGVAVHIDHYYFEVPIDLDKLAKPILDGLKGNLIVDDMQVERLVIRRFWL